MNINTSAWTNIDLPEVLYGVGVGVGLCLYVFAVKGWLR